MLKTHIRKVSPKFLNQHNKILFIIFVFFLLCSVYFNLIYKIPIRYWDEHEWIGRSYFFELYLKREFDDPLWNTHCSYEQPKLQDYIYGMWLYPLYLIDNKVEPNEVTDMRMFLASYNFYCEPNIPKNTFSLPRSFIYWGGKGLEVFDLTHQQLVERFGIGITKTISLIYHARKVNVFFLALNVIVVYYFSFFISSNYFIALIAAFLFGTNTFIVFSSLQAHSEGTFLLLFNASLLLLATLWKRKLSSHIFYVILLGIMSGLIMSTKLNGLIILFIFNVLLGLLFLNDIKNMEKNKGIILKGLVVNFITIGIFILLNPYTYSHIPNKMLKMYEWRNQASYEQTLQFPRDLLPSHTSRIKQIVVNYLSDTHFLKPIYVENSTINKLITIIVKTIFPIGFIVLLYYSLIRRNSLTSFFLFTFFLTLILTVVYLKLNWDRYFIHFSLFVVLIEATGLYYLIWYTLVVIRRLCIFIVRRCSYLDRY